MELRIAICDDEQKQSEYVNTIVNKWVSINNIKVNIEIFNSAESFKNKHKMFDILLLDIQMGGQSGIELARELRRTDDNLIIIFITALTDFISEGYEVSAMHYLVKPIKESKLFETLDKAYKNFTQYKKFLIVNSKGKDCRILFEDIVYIEAFKHYVIVTAADGTEYEVRSNISSIENDLDNSFFKCQRSYIVMIKHIKHITKTEVFMDNGRIISLSRNIYKDLYTAFIGYFKGKEEFLNDK